jgi:hypothetical protein
MRFCLIVTGQLRTFFDRGMRELVAVITRTQATQQYSHLHLVFIPSGADDDALAALGRLSDTLVADHQISSTTVPYDPHSADQINAERFSDPIYLARKARYLAEVNSSHAELPDPDRFIVRNGIQFDQLACGLQALDRYEQQTGLSFDVLGRTRFDVSYHPDFVFVMPPPEADARQLLLLSQTNARYFAQCRVDVLSPAYRQWLRAARIVLPDCRVEDRPPSRTMSTTLGGAYYYNWVTVEAIIAGAPAIRDRILYCYNDHFFFGLRATFYQLRELHRCYGRIIEADYRHLFPDDIPHFFAPESQLLIFCLSHGIYPVMHLYPGSHGLIRS